jgi:hypothetical protein
LPKASREVLPKANKRTASRARAQTLVGFTQVGTGRLAEGEHRKASRARGHRCTKLKKMGTGRGSAAGNPHCKKQALRRPDVASSFAGHLNP